MSAGPYPIQDAVRTVVAQKVSITVASEASGPGAQGREALGVSMLARHLGRQGAVDQGLIESLGVQVELYFPAGLRGALEDGFPERVASFTHSALGVGP